MKHRFACLALTLLSITSGLVVMSAHSSPSPAAGDIDILVNGVQQRRYAHQGRWYVEALKGSDYAIRIRNPYGVRVAVALSVDGLNTIDARQTTATAARKWVLDPYQTIVISGWQTSQTEARRFEFTTEENSYGQALGKTANLGVISAVFFKEKVPTYLTEQAPRDARPQSPAAAAPAPAAGHHRGGSADSRAKADNEYAATGMGQRTDHAVTQVSMDLESTPASTVSIRYEFHPQLVKLGVLQAPRVDNPLARRERARGFEPGFCPEPKRR